LAQAPEVPYDGEIMDVVPSAGRPPGTVDDTMPPKPAGKREKRRKHDAVPENKSFEETVNSWSPVEAPSGFTRRLQSLCPVALLPAPKAYLEPQRGSVVGRKTLVLDLDETLVYSSTSPLEGVRADFVVDVELSKIAQVHRVHVHKRPGLEVFLKEMAQVYELVVFTASISEYASPVIDQLDKIGIVAGRLYREHCTLRDGHFVKDLSRLGRKLRNMLIIDNSPDAYSMQPDMGLPIQSWYGDNHDKALFELIPVLHAISHSACISEVLVSSVQRWKKESDAISVTSSSDGE